MMQNAHVGHGKTKMDKNVRRELPCVRRSRSLYSKLFIRVVVLMSMERKNDEEAKKKQKKKGLTKRYFL
jgi:hypothetical protein